MSPIERGSEDGSKGFSDGYSDALVELSGLSGYFQSQSLPLEHQLVGISAVCFSIPDVLHGTEDRLLIAITDVSVCFTKRVPYDNPYGFTKRVEDRYDINPDGTMRNRYAPNGVVYDLSEPEPVYAVDRILKESEDFAGLVSKLRAIREHLERNPIDPSKNSSTSFEVT